MSEATKIIISPFCAYGKALQEATAKTVFITVIVLATIALLAFVPGKEMDSFHNTIIDIYEKHSEISAPITVVVGLIVYGVLCYLSCEYLKPSLPPPVADPLPSVQPTPPIPVEPEQPPIAPAKEQHRPIEIQNQPQNQQGEVPFPGLSLFDVLTEHPYEFYNMIKHGEPEGTNAVIEDSIVAKDPRFAQIYECIAEWAENPQDPLSPNRNNPIYVCNCAKMTHELRVDLERQSIELLTQTHKKEDLITILSLGAGGCYQEMVMVAKLVKAGYTNIRLVLVDRIPPNLKRINEIMYNLLKFDRNNIQIQYYPSVQEYLNHPTDDRSIYFKPRKTNLPTPIDLFLAIDLTDHMGFADSTYSYLRHNPGYCLTEDYRDNFHDNTVIVTTGYGHVPFEHGNAPYGKAYRYDSSEDRLDERSGPRKPRKPQAQLL